MVKMVQGDDVPLHHYAATLRCPRSENLMYDTVKAGYCTCIIMYVQYAGDLLAGRGAGGGPRNLL